MHGSDVEAQSVEIVANALALISDKESKYQASFSDKSGVLTRTIIDQGDIKESAVSTAVGHVVSESIGDTLLDQAISGEITREQAKAQIEALSSVISGAVTLATHENVTDEELAITQNLSESVVANGWLNGDANYEFKGIYPSYLDLKNYHPFKNYYPVVKEKLKEYKDE